jgi:hypothetical protein
MKRLHFAIGLLAAMAGSGLQAQAVLEAKVPFEFRMGEVNFPAGDYQFKYSGQLLVVHQQQGQRATAMALPLPVSRIKPPSTGLLEFNKYGEAYFLSKIWTPGSTDGSAVRKTSREQELARATPPFRTEAILIQSK